MAASPTFRAVIFDLDGVLWDGEPLYHEAFNVILEPHGAPGVRALIGELRHSGVPIAVASTSLRAWVDATLRGLDLEGAFNTVVSASEVANGKPDPDLFLAAAARLGVPPDRCLAVEDTGPGIAAAKAAGMFAVH